MLLLFMVIAIGYFFGKIKIKGLNLGVAAVLFVGLAVGSFSENFILPDVVYTLGLVLFVYTVGLHSGSGFFSSFNKTGLTYNLFVICLLSISAAFTLLLARIFGLDSEIAAGLFSGSMTNTPALASILDSIKIAGQGTDPALLAERLGKPVAGYSIAYPFGVIGVILSMHFFRKIFKIDLDAESMEVAKSSGLGGEDLHNRDIIITNKEIFDMKVKDVIRQYQIKDVVISRIKKKNEILLVYGETRLQENDIITLVGTFELIEKCAQLFGVRLKAGLAYDREQLDYRRIFVSSEEIIGKTVLELELPRKFQAMITRIKRGDHEFIPKPDTVLEAGDRVRVVTPRENMKKVTRFFGDSFESLTEIDYIGFAIGITIGLVLGDISIPLPGGSSFKLGAAGGPLIVALILGKLERTKNIIWVMSYNANHTLRQFGIVLFLAGIGLKAGYSFGANFEKYGLLLLGLGVAVTLLNTLLLLFIGRFILKIKYPLLMGMLAGVQTQPACMAYVNGEVKNNAPAATFTIVYPTAIIVKIILAQLILGFLK